MLKVDPATLPSYAAGVITSMHLSAYQEIVGCLTERGFSKAVIDTWDRGAEFERALSLFWCLTNLGGMHAYDDKFLKQFDRRKDLVTVQVYVNGKNVNPTEADGGTISGGPPDTSLDEFVLDPSDPRIGSPTRW